MHVLSDANGLPLRVGLSAANTHNSLALKPMLSHFHMGHESHAADSKPVRLHADKAYDVPHLRRWLWGKRIGVRIARKGIDSSERLGRRRWVIERTMSWLTGYRRLNHRYERKPGNYLAFLGLASALCCYKRLSKQTDHVGHGLKDTDRFVKHRVQGDDDEEPTDKANHLETTLFTLITYTRKEIPNPPEVP
jgi:transposase